MTGRYSERRDGLGVQVADRAIATAGEVKPRRAYYPGYVAWEQRRAITISFPISLCLG